ncbi:glycosyltransferase family A protein [Escherichia albertii]|uniref:Predicted glycosyltransferase, group II family n=1 Tax=Escherichia albertii TaxID=208962 RepID=A0A5A4U4I8_ESCAL|nr:glycosyltransferase family A protein [Escherichia albertii]MCZ7516690.1 glycosyltransferase family A protein [Escherichia albertii]BBM62599.1 predicted glycosyltransferase, group II family [Escherichia albertii]
MKMYLLMPTIGRTVEIENFILSVGKRASSVQLLIADQNAPGFIETQKLYECSENIDLHYFHSEQKGLSSNRNLLLSKLDSQEGIIAFPDDDCLYYEDTLDLVISFFEDNPDVDVLLGCIYDRSCDKYLFKKWPRKRLIVNYLNVYFMSSSITIFVRKPNLHKFDPVLGAGAEYGACEDPDYLYGLLKKGYKIVYDPSIQVWHPAPDYHKISLDKVYSYAKGFGYFVRKDIDAFKILLLVLLISKKLFQLVFKSKNFPVKYFKMYFSGLIHGFLRKHS